MTTTNKLADALRNLLAFIPDVAANGSVASPDHPVMRAGFDALAAHAASLAAPPAQGEWVLVPREPTEAMIEAAEIREDDEPPSDWGKIVRASHEAIYAAMLAASPQPAPAPVQADAVPRCPKCGYTYEDCLIHWDHRLCGEPDPSAAAQPPAPGEAGICDHAEVDQLVEFFRKEGYMRFGLNGDNMGWSPAETAIAAMREYMAKEAAITAPPAPGEAELPPIEVEAGMDRHYIPLPGGWEVQTKGTGSTFRICDTKSGERMPVVETMLHPWLERMAREVHAAIAALAQPQDAKAIVDHMVNRFLSWKLPQDFAPDCGISFAPLTNPEWTHDVWPIGTNLLHAGQAKALVEHMLVGIVTPTSIDAQQRVPDAVRELPGKWRSDYRSANRYWNHACERCATELEHALATIDQQQEARGNGE